MSPMALKIKSKSPVLRVYTSDKVSYFIIWRFGSYASSLYTCKNMPDKKKINCKTPML